MNAMRDEQLEAMRNDPTSAIFDYQVSSAERFKHVNDDMFMNGSQDSDSHSPLMVYIRSRSAARQRNLRDPRSTSRRSNLGPSKSTRSRQSKAGMIMETMAVNSSRRWYR